jgi:hypothetical protein
LAIVATAAAVPAIGADLEVIDPNGRRILLKDDGTWRALDDKAAGPGSAASGPQAPPESAELQLLQQVESTSSCRFEFELNNTLPYEIRSLVPEFSVYRANGVAYATDSRNFGPVRPGDKVRRALRFSGITCADITRLQVHGGDRCEMGDLNKFSDAKGSCLAKLRVLPSPLLKFEK